MGLGSMAKKRVPGNQIEKKTKEIDIMGCTGHRTWGMFSFKMVLRQIMV